ncbi:MAG: phage major capsid protein, partial [Lactobacillus crispatus]|nr:phage major capsid protein [Lactobacillus crispatus]
MNINELHDAWIEAGNKVENLMNDKLALQAKYNANPDSVTVDDMKKANENYKKAVEARNFAKQNYEDAKANLKPAAKKPVKSNSSNAKKTAEEVINKFASDFTNLVKSGDLPDGSKASSNAGLTIPDDVQTAIHTLVRQYASLESLVNVENVSTSHGSRVYEKLADITPLKDLDDDSALIGDNDDPVLTVVKYTIHRYAGINTITNTLLKDTAENLIAWLETWIARKDVVTRNLKILEVMGKAPKKPTIAKFDDIKDLENNTLDPAINTTSSFVTNQSGYNILSKLKDADGKYLIQPDVTQPDKYVIDGKLVKVIADKWLPDVSGSHPLYFGDLKQGITLYDR